MNFVKNFIALTLVVGIAQFALQKLQIIPAEKEIWVLFGLISITTFLALFSALKGTKSEEQNFINHFYISVGIKLFVILFFVLIYLQFVTVNRIVFGVAFLLHYLIYTLFEIKTLLGNLRAEK
jgi:hypothetical protein